VNTECWWGKLSEGGNLEELILDGEIILNLIFKKWDGAGTTTGCSG
jgi:hypothetical protein